MSKILLLYIPQEILIICICSMYRTNIINDHGHKTNIHSKKERNILQESRKPMHIWPDHIYIDIIKIMKFFFVT